MITHYYDKSFPKNPVVGDQAWTCIIPLVGEDNYLHIHLGRKGRDLLFGMLIADNMDSGESEPPTGMINNQLIDLVPQTYGEAIEVWNKLFMIIDCPNYEWDNRTTQENTIYLLKQLRELYD